jgi:hypothetical protein
MVMAKQKKAPAAGRKLRGGTEGGETARAVDVAMKDSGTPGIAAPSGDDHVEPPSRYTPRTDLPARPPQGTDRLMGGRPAQEVLEYLRGVEFPATKDHLVRAARRNGAPEDVLWAMNELSATEYASPEALLLGYPPLPDSDDVEPVKG